MTTPKKIVAAFDFDKTMTTHDTLLPFLYTLHSCPQNIIKSLQLAPTLIAYKTGLLDNHSAKQKLLSTFINNMKYDALYQKAQIFSEVNLSHYVKPEALKRLRWHQSQQHECVLISAGLEIYLASWAKLQGFHHLLATKLHEKNGQIDGRNCFGQEKVNRLLNLLGPKENFTLYAYGDSRGDKELLALADYKFYRTMPDIL